MTTKNRTTQTKVETKVFTRKEVEEWTLPFFQRNDRPNAKVHELSESLKRDGGVLPGILTFGVVDRKEYLIDGRQRRFAFLLSGVDECWADCRTCYCSSMAELSEEYVDLNSHLVAMKPDDIMRGLEPCVEALAYIRERCPFVGYDYVRKGDRSPMVSMSALMRSWFGSSTEVPGAVGTSAANIARNLTHEDAEQVSRFLDCCFSAWGRDEEYFRLWTNLNLTLCMWTYRRIVLTQYSSRTKRINDDQFAKLLMSLSTSATYLDWIVGRRMCDRDRSPAYGRIKDIFSARLFSDTGERHLLPAPAWAHGKTK